MGYHALASTKSSGRTPPLDARARVLQIGEIPVVLARDVVTERGRRLAVRDADDAKRGMLGRIGDLAFQGFEAPTQNVRFGRTQLLSELCQSRSIRPVEVDLNRFAYA